MKGKTIVHPDLEPAYSLGLSDVLFGIDKNLEG